MERVAIIARLKEGTHKQAMELVEKGPPFDPTEAGFVRHAVYLSTTDVVFVFEGHEVEWLVDSLVFDPLKWPLSEAIAEWRPLVEESPRVARGVFAWEASVADAPV